MFRFIKKLVSARDKDKPIRIAIDTNIMVAAMMKPTGASRKILDMWIHGRLSLLVTGQIRREYLTILSQRWVKSDWVSQVNGRIDEYAEMVVAEERIRVIKEDPSDNMFLECAVAGKADYIITSDRHLLALKRFGETEIVTPTRFLKLVESKP
jgi:putative PIN family toxin of toxin-antitoxin system